MAVGHVITSGGGLQAGDLTSINNVRLDHAWGVPNDVDIFVNTNASPNGGFARFSAPDRVLIRNTVCDANLNLINTFDGGNTTIFNSGITAINYAGSSINNNISINRLNRNGEVLNTVNVPVSYSGRYWYFPYCDSDPTTGNFAIAFREYERNIQNQPIRVIGISSSGAKIAELSIPVTSGYLDLAGLTISANSIYVAVKTGDAPLVSPTISKMTFSGGTTWSISFPAQGGTLGDSSATPSGCMKVSYDDTMLYVQAYSTSGKIGSGPIVALYTSNGARAGGGSVAVSGSVIFTSTNPDGTFCTSTKFFGYDSVTSFTVSRYNKYAELLERSPELRYDTSNATGIRFGDKVASIYANGGCSISTVYPTVPANWQILE